MTTLPKPTTKLVELEPVGPPIGGGDVFETRASMIVGVVERALGHDPNASPDDQRAARKAVDRMHNALLTPRGKRIDRRTRDLLVLHRMVRTLVTEQADLSRFGVGIVCALARDATGDERLMSLDVPCVIAAAREAKWGPRRKGGGAGPPWLTAAIATACGAFGVPCVPPPPRERRTRTAVDARAAWTAAVAKLARTVAKHAATHT